MRRILFLILVVSALYKVFPERQPETRPTAALTPGVAQAPTRSPNPAAGDTAPGKTSDRSARRRSTDPDRTVLYVSGSTVRVRSGPGTDYDRITAFKRGHRLAATGERDGKWVRVLDEASRVEGWMHGDYLSKTPIEAALEAVKGPPPSAPAPSVTRTRTGPSDAEIGRRIIARSIAGYPGSCACPYSRDRAGRTCGNRSAWSRPGGYAPICYENEVDDRMVQAWKARN